MVLAFWSHLPPPRWTTYGLFSIGLFCFGILRCKHIHSYSDHLNSTLIETNQIPLFERIMLDNCIVMVAFNTVFCLLISLAKGLQYAFLGPLVGLEPEFIRDVLVSFVRSRAVLLIGIINASKWGSLLAWTLWLGCFVILYGYACLARLRCEQLFVSSSVSRRQWISFGSMVVVFAISTVLLLSFGLKFCSYLSDVTPEADLFGDISARYSVVLEESDAIDFGDKSSSVDIYQIIHVLVYMFSDCFLVLVLLLRIALIIVINLLDWTSWAHGLSAYDKNTWLYSVNYIIDVTALSLDFLNHVHMFLWSRMASLTTPVVCIQMFSGYNSLSRRIRRHLAYRSHIKAVRQEFPLEKIDRNQTSTESDGVNAVETETCAICWDPLFTWRRLPCKHCFHESCLTMWIQQDPSCPTCRRRILSRTSRRHTAVRQEPSLVSTLVRHIFDFFNGAAASDGEAERTGNPQRATRNVLLRLRQPVAQRDSYPGFDFSVRVTLGSGRRRQVHPDAPTAPPPPPAGTTQTTTVTSSEPTTQTANQQDAIIQSTTRTRLYHFDGPSYFAWLPIFEVEFSETEEHVTPMAMNPPQRFPDAAGDAGSRTNRRGYVSTTVISHTRPSVSPASSVLRRRIRRNESNALLSSSSTVTAVGGIAAAFPTVPRAAILADLAATGVPEVTVDNILQGRLGPRTHSLTSPSRSQDQEAPVAAAVQIHGVPEERTTVSGQTRLTEEQALQEQQYQETQGSSPVPTLAQRRQQLFARARHHLLSIQQRQHHRVAP